MRRAPPKSLPSLVEPGQKPVRPKDSGTLIVLRRQGEGLEVLMGWRARKAVFGGVFVFPGGKVDAADRSVGVASDLAPDVLTRISKDQRRARGFSVAAVRETFEETGLLLAGPADVGSTKHETWMDFAARGIAPDLPLVDVTEFMLLEVQRRHGENLAPREKYPFFSYRTDSPYIRYS